MTDYDLTATAQALVAPGKGILAAQGALTVTVSATFPLECAVDAFDLVEAGHTRQGGHSAGRSG